MLLVSGAFLRSSYDAAGLAVKLETPLDFARCADTSGRTMGASTGSVCDLNKRAFVQYGASFPGEQVRFPLILVKYSNVFNRLGR